MLEDAGQTDLVRLSLLSLLRRSDFTELGLTHYGRCPANGYKEEEHRIWEAINEERKLETLESKMVALRPMPLVDLKQALLAKEILVAASRRDERRKRRAENQLGEVSRIKDSF